MTVDPATVAKERLTSVGLYVTAREAYDRSPADPEGVRLLDVRKPVGYVFVGHAPMAGSIPWRSRDPDGVFNGMGMKERLEELGAAPDLRDRARTDGPAEARGHRAAAGQRGGPGTAAGANGRHSCSRPGAGRAPMPCPPHAGEER
jgi:hypothetical protein